MALLALREAQFRAKQVQLDNANRILEGLETDLRDLVEQQSIWKQKILYKIMLASVRQNVAQQRRLLQRLERINHVSYSSNISLHFICTLNVPLTHVF